MSKNWSKSSLDALDFIHVVSDTDRRMPTSNSKSVGQGMQTLRAIMYKTTDMQTLGCGPSAGHGNKYHQYLDAHGDPV